MPEPPKPPDMPSNKNAQTIMSAIATDASKVLGVVIGDKKLEPPGLYIPRGGAYHTPSPRSSTSLLMNLAC